MADPQDIDLATDDSTPADESNDHSKESFLLLLIGAIGVVYGDIGTSPIYAFREALRAGAGNHDILKFDVYGVISLIFWALLLIVTIKYVVFVLRADNNGDAVITPAVSVLSAVEGMEVVAPDLEPFVVPLTLIILAALFAVQKFGTGKVAIVFGPITLVWFLALGGFGLFHIFDDLTILKSLFPGYAISYVVSNPATSFAAVGAVFLAVTGAEALYADLGHFGRRPIVAAWLWIVFPCLVLNYLGQGAFILSHGRNTINPFYQMLPEWALIPMIILATMATVIAAQAVITGAFSMARQAVQLNILPRLEILHTSEKNLGQIYMPRINLILAVIVILLVIGFERSSNLAAAYGISVTGNMIVTTSLLFIVMRRIWKWRLALCLLPTLAFLCLDLLFFSANLIKIHDGGWVSVGLACSVVLIMWTWVRGSRHLFKKTRKAEVPLDLIVTKMAEKPPIIVPGTAVFLTSDPKSAPSALMHSLKHYKVLHENNVILTVNTASTPRVSSVDRARVSQFNERFMQVTLTFGYMEQPNIPKALAICRKLGWKFDIMTTSFFVSRRSIKPAAKSDMPMWQDKFYIFLARTAADATEYFQIPTGRVVEIGTQITV